MELSTLIQGTREVQVGEVEHLPYYIQRLKEKVIDFKQKLDEMPPANVAVSIAKKKL